MALDPPVNEGHAANAEAGPSSAPAWPLAPNYHFTSSPKKVDEVNASKLDNTVKGNFFRQARWCPGGTAILTTSEDRALRLYDTVSTNQEPTFSEARVFVQPDAIHSTVWYPTASKSSPETFCFAAGIRDAPIRLIDARNGTVRATYPIIDHRERFVAPHSMAWSPDATRLYCGFDSAIEVFDIASPGAAGDRLKTSYTRREKGGQKGIISALVFCSDYSGTYAAGSFAGSISLYSEDTGATAISHIDGVTGGGVTQLAFHPLSPHILVSASRRSSAIQLFDIRNPTAGAYAELPRPGSTNQRLWFDVDPWGRWLASGDEDGVVRVWDIGAGGAEEPIWEAKLSDDAVGSVQFHPYHPLFLTASGSRRYLDSAYDKDSATSSDSDTESDNSSDVDDEDEPAPSRATWNDPRDASMRLWSVASPQTTES